MGGCGEFSNNKKMTQLFGKKNITHIFLDRRLYNIFLQRQVGRAVIKTKSYLC